MTSFEDLLIKLGVPTYTTQIFKDLNATVTGNTIELGDDVPTNLGWIYGMSIHTDGFKPSDASKSLITLANAYDLWFTFVYGTANVTQYTRLSDMVFNVPPSTTRNGVRTQELNYMPISTPQGGDWRKSIITNPTGITTGTIMMNLFFIDEVTYQNLVASGVLWKGGRKPAQ